jgi:hypothetical protein
MTMIKQMGMAGALVGTLALGGGCSHFGGNKGEQTWTMRSIDKAPAAQGKVEVASAKDGNHDVKVEVKHMAPPDKIFEGSTAYVVWLKAENGSFQNVGTLKVDKDLNGKLETRTPFRTFDVLVTAEKESTVNTPSEHHVMNAKVDVAV